MRKVKFLSVIKISTVVLSMVAGFTGATYGVNSVYAENVEIRDNIETSASSGKIIIGVEGYDYTSAQQDIIERINEIRHEACYAGNVPNPNKTSEYLKPSDYKPIQLGVSCTKAATIRSAEGAVRLAHVRPNSYACNTVLSHFLGSSMVSSAENLAWSNDHSSDLEQWYGEKKYWVDKNTSYETGHYTTLINPNYTYCGIATFNPDNDEIYTSSGWKADWCCTAGSFSSTDVAIAENNYKDKQNKPVIQKMEMTPSNVINITPIGNPLLHVGDNSKFELVVDVKYSGAANCTVKNCSVYDGITWSSSDSTIVSINSSTGAVSAKKTGQVTITATMGSGSSIKKKEFDCVVVPAGVEPVEAVDPDMVTVESYKTPTLSNSVSIKLSDGTSIEVSPIWDSYNSSLVQTHFKSTEFNVTGKACGLDVVQKVHVNAAKITNVFCEEKQGDTYIKVTSKTTDSGTSVSYPSCGISLSNGLTWTYPATWTTRQKQNYKNRAGGTFTEEGYTTVSTDEGSKKLEISFELIVNPASVTSVVYDEKEITTPSGTEPVYPVATVKWTNGDIDNADSPGAKYGYIKWVQTDDFKNAYKKRNGGSYEITGTYYDAVNDVSYSDSTTVTVNVTPATVTSVVYDDDEIVVENGTSPVSKLPKKASVTWSNNDNEDLDITWDEISEDSYKNLNKTATTFTVTGQVDCGNNVTKDVSVSCKVLPATVKEIEVFDQIETLEEVLFDSKLPEKASVKWSNGLSSKEDIVWNEVDKDKLKVPDSIFDLKGSLKDVEGTEDAVSISVYVKPKSLESLSWYDEDNKQASAVQTAKETVFYDNYDLSKISGKLIAAYDNGTTAVFGIGSKQISISNYDEDSKESSQTAILSYTYNNGKDEPITKSVEMILTLHLPAELVITPPTKLEYVEGQELDMTGFVAVTYYDDETVKRYEEGSVNYSISGYNKNKLGKQTVSITQDGITKTFEVNVIPKIATAIAISDILPQKVEKALNPGETEVEVTYNDGDKKNFTLEELMSESSISISGYDSSVIGNQTITLTYNDVNNEYDSDLSVEKEIEVKDKIVISVSVTKKPDKLQYIEGLPFEVKGGKVNVVYDNDTEEEKDLTEDMISGYSSEEIGDQVITVTIDGKKDTFKVNVRAKQITKVDFTGPSKTVYLENQDFDLEGTSAVISYDNNTTDDADVAFDVDGGTLVADAVLYLDGISVSEKKLKAGSYTFKIGYKTYSSDEYSIEVKAPVKNAVSAISEDDLNKLSGLDDSSSAEEIAAALEGMTITLPCADGTNVTVVMTRDMIGTPETLQTEDESGNPSDKLTDDEKKMVETAAAENKAVKKVAIEVSKDEEDNPVYTYVYLSVNKKPVPTPTPTATPAPTDKPEVTPTPSDEETPVPTETPEPTEEPDQDEESQVKAPSKPTVKSVKNLKGKKIRVKWKKVKGAKGYQVQYARNKSFTKSKKTVTTTKLTFTKKGFKKKKTYYVRVRAYTKDENGDKVYGQWSKVKKVKIKK